MYDVIVARLHLWLETRPASIREVVCIIRSTTLRLRQCTLLSEICWRQTAERYQFFERVSQKTCPTDNLSTVCSF